MARLVLLNKVLRHLKIPLSQIKCTGVELGNAGFLWKSFQSGLQWKIMRC